MDIPSWIISGIGAGWLVGMMLGMGHGVTGDFIFGILGGLVGGSLASILFIVSGGVKEANAIAAIIAFTFAAICLAVKRVVIRPLPA